MSNSETINESLPEDDRLKSLMIQTSDGKRSKRVLDLYWNTETDVFYFTICMPRKSRTKRGMLATMNLMFDPLGFVTPMKVKAKLIYRSLCQKDLDWDKPLP